MRTFYVLFVILLFMAAVLAWITRVPVSTAGHLLTGWMAFIGRTCVRLTVNGNAVLTALVCIALLIAGGHPFLKWLITSSVASAPRHAGGSTAREAVTASAHIRWSWIRTAQLLGVFMLLFMAGTAFIGLVHQTAWLATSPEPLTEYRLDIPYFRSEWNTGFIGNGFTTYADVYHQLPANGPAPELKQGSHSWQTRIMPLAGYRMDNVHFERDWDDEANAPAFKRFVREYLSPDIGVLRDNRGYAVSHYAGNRHVFAREKPLTNESLAESTSNFIVCGEVAGNFMAWADPANLRDPVEGINQAAKGFGGADGRGASFVMLDGSVRFLSSNTDRGVLAALAIPTVSQESARVTPDPDISFNGHLQRGTVFSEGWKEFHKNRRMEEFAVLLRDRWKGRAEEGVSLALQPLPNHEYRVGESFDCQASLTQDGPEPRLLDTGGSCGMTDALTLIVFAISDGQAFSCRGAVGGPHCFCKPKQELVPPSKSVNIAAGFASEAAVSWKPDKAGEYLVIGQYALTVRDRRLKIIYSAPLVVMCR